MQPVSDSNVSMTEEEYLQECSNRAASACDSFQYDSSGFTATISLDSPNLVFFSVPYDEGWTATVNGKPVDVEEVDNGLMAVPVEAGDNTIEFHYETPGLHLGAWLTLGGVILLIVYLLICRKLGIRRNKETVCCIDYPVSAEDEALPELTDETDTTEESPAAAEPDEKTAAADDDMEVSYNAEKTIGSETTYLGKVLCRKDTARLADGKAVQRVVHHSGGVRCAAPEKAPFSWSNSSAIPCSR
ncbi:MAG: YfhO family protein [Ruminococcus sp.]